ncbi:MAG: ParB/RepB/Spo0J family partition protein [Clostridia bacterium]|nr:ParB/RepB/Spo0J family partition protein [Clostridia bacterium]
MSAKGLGMGLDALFMDNSSASADKGVATVKISLVEPNLDQPRKDFDPEALADLCESIKTHGILQPLAVREIAGGRYQIIAGERRWRAAREAGLAEVPVYVVEADDKKVMELALVENLQRQDLNPIEEAEGYRVLMNDFSLTQEDCAARIGKSRSAIANTLRLLTLAPVVREMVADGRLSAGHAKALLSIVIEKKQIDAANLVLAKNLTVRQTEVFVKKLLESSKAKPTAAKSVTVNYLEEIERNLSGKLGRKVKVTSGRKKGKLELEFYNPEDLEKLIKLLEQLGREL